MPAFDGAVRSRWSSTDEARRFDVINPATGGVLAQVHRAGTAEVDQAVKAAAEAQRSWARRAPAEDAGQGHKPWPVFFCVKMC
jgi:lactaldehyde dehydrogenase / glycolaldehyde dehydrogenase